jgi:PAS domain S-box-containing protein
MAMNDPSTDQNLSLDEVSGLSKRLSELEQSHRQCQQQVEQLTQQLIQEKAARQQAEERLQLTLTSAQMIAWDMDLSTHQVICSTNACKVWGIDEGSGEDFFKVIHPDDRFQVMQAQERALAGETVYFQEYRVIDSQGKVRWLNSQGRVYLDQAGRGIRVIGLSVDVTKRKQTEIALRASEERLRLAMEAAQMGTWDLDLISGQAIWSEQHFTILGYEPVTTGEASEAMWLSRIHADDLERVTQTWQQSQQAHNLYQAEYRVIRADNGQIAWLSSLGSFTDNQTGQAVRSIGVICDITKTKHDDLVCKQAEAALAKSNQTLQAIIQACPLAIIGLRADGTVRIWNPAAKRIFGWSQEEVLDQFLPSIPDDRRDEFLHNLAVTIQGQGLVGSETRRQKKGKVLFDVELWTAAVDETQAGISCVSVVADISEAKRDETIRKQAEAALQESKERFQALADNIAQLAWMADGQGWLFWYNQRWFDYTGTTLEEMQGWGWRTVHHPDHIERVVKKFRQHLESGETWEDTFPLRSQDGSYRWFLSRAVPIRDDQGRVLRWFGTNTDITDRQQVEAEREQLLKRERAAREQAEAANRVKDEFLAVLSHELRTPLNPILGWAKLLRTRRFDPHAADRALEIIERNAKLQVQLIEDLLDVSRILQGKVGLNPCPVNLVTPIEAALETVRLSAEAKGIQIQTVLNPEVGQIHGDANRLQQVMWNLLSNAIKFTPSGGRVEVRLEKIGGQAQIQISDTGQGISPDFLPHVFEYFRQADATTTRHFGGLGLGLAIVHYLVELHGGTIQAESPGRDLGATFTVQLPVMASVSAPAPEEISIQETKSLSGIQILVVDDEADMRDLISFILEERGATVITAASATEALQLITVAVPDVLISDIGMPETDGYALIRQIRMELSEQGKIIPAIALTAYAGDINHQKAIAAGFQLHLAKPIEPEQLLKSITQMITQSFPASC